MADSNTFFVGCNDYRASGVGNDDSGRSFVEYMTAAFGAKGLVTSKDPEQAEIQAAVEAVGDAGQIILCTCNGHLFRGQIALAEALAATGKKLTVVAMRNPYDIPALPDCACKIAAYDYSAPAFRALEDVFRGGAMTGVCPVAL